MNAVVEALAAGSGHEAWMALSFEDRMRARLRRALAAPIGIAVIIGDDKVRDALLAVAEAQPDVAEPGEEG